MVSSREQLRSSRSYKVDSRTRYSHIRLNALLFGVRQQVSFLAVQEAGRMSKQSVIVLGATGITGAIITEALLGSPLFVRPLISEVCHKLR